MRNLKSLYEKYGHSYESATLEISREIVKVFKGYLYHEEEPGSTYGVGNYEMFGGVLPVVVGFVEGTKILVNASISINKRTNTPFMVISLMYRPGSVNQDFNHIVTEVKASVRHELEHIGQMQKQGKAEIDWENPAANPAKQSKNGKIDPKVIFKYYMLPHEVEAHVKGLLKQAKVKRVPLQQELVSFVDHLTDLNDKQRRKVLDTYVGYANSHNLFRDKPISKTYAQNNESKMNTPTVMSFKEFKRIDEKEESKTGAGGLKNLVGKGTGEDLNVTDAKRIGQKISKMSGKARQKYIGIVNFMGASCKVFNAIWQNYKPVDKSRKTQNAGKEYVKPMPAPAA